MNRWPRQTEPTVKAIPTMPHRSTATVSATVNRTEPSPRGERSDSPTSSPSHTNGEHLCSRTGRPGGATIATVVYRREPADRNVGLRVRVAHESTCVARQTRCPARHGAGPRTPGTHRRNHSSHADRSERIGPAPLRSARAVSRAGDILRHEPMGIVEAVGPSVHWTDQILPLLVDDDPLGVDSFGRPPFAARTCARRIRDVSEEGRRHDQGDVPSVTPPFPGVPARSLRV